MLPLAADYPFLDILGSMLFFFFFVIWLWMLFAVYGDIFSRHDISGWAKAGWVVVSLVLPYLGVLIYLGTQGKGMAERKAAQMSAAQSQFDQYVRETAGGDGAAGEIAKAKQLLDSGAISQPEFDELKRKALA
jgi:Short C-terminal domain/Phospholipase_D-nuclease N-terminal